MGKKGGGRKGFVKTAMTPQGEGVEPLAARDLPEGGAANPQQNGTDPSLKFLKGNEAAQSPADLRPIVEEKPVELLAEPVEASQETRGQLAQRHKRELKTLKEHIKKLGKKRKDEAEALEHATEARHAAEVVAWETSHEEDDAHEGATFVAPAAGLYDLKIGTEEKSAKKPTKAQKRREQRAAEEAERDAVIADEQSGMGSSQREQEAQSLKQLLEPLGLAMHDILADGNCMYNAVQHQLCSDTSPAPNQGELREETASYMRAFPDDFKPFVVPESESGQDADEAFDKYCTEIEETAAWGGQPELQALAQALERHILVYAVGLPIVEMGEEYKGKQRSLQICYLRHAYGLGEHYNSVEPLASS